MNPDADLLAQAAKTLRALAGDESVAELNDFMLQLALADLLAAQAEHVGSYDCEAHCEYPDGCRTSREAVRVARLIIAGAETHA